MSLRQQVIIEDLVEASEAIKAELDHMITKKGSGQKYQQFFNLMTTPRFSQAFIKLQRALMRGRAYLKEPDEPGVNIPY